MTNARTSGEFAELLDNEESYMSRWCEVADFHGVRFYRSQFLPTHLFNFVTRLWHFPDGVALLEQVERYYGASSLPHRLFFGPMESQHLASFFADSGYALLSDRLILAHDLTHIPQATSPHVHVKAIVEEADLQDWVRVAVKSWKHPDFPEDFERIVSSTISGGIADGEFSCYLAEIDGNVVGTGLMNKTGQLAGIHAVTTIPAARGQGVASALITRLVADAAARGFTRVCLQTGKGDGADTLYQRLGFGVLYALHKYGPTSEA